MNTNEQMPVSGKGGTEQSRLFSAIGYLPPLFFIPLFLGEKDAFSKFHGKQGLVVTVLAVAGGLLAPFVSSLIPVIGALVVFAFNVCVLLLVIFGAYRAFQGTMWELPVVGKWAKNLNI